MNDSADSWIQQLTELSTCELEQQSCKLLYEFCRELKEFNEHTNLVANADPVLVLKEHVLDSLQLLPLVLKLSPDLGQTTLIDIGSGAGFPGIVLAIANPNLKVTLVESIGKKCRFLENAVTHLGLKKRVLVVCDRAEQIGHDKKFREKFHFATARAVGSLQIVAELCLPFLRVSGHLLAQRSKRQALEEQPLADGYASRLGGSLSDTIFFEPDAVGRELSLFLIQKTKNTPGRFPRNAAAMKHDN